MIARTVAAAGAVRGDRVIVVDDGSTDKTAERRAAGAGVIKPGLTGEGYALKLGSRRRRKGGAGEATQEGFLLILDADLETAGEGRSGAGLGRQGGPLHRPFPAPRKKAGCGLVRNPPPLALSLLTGLKVTAPLRATALSPKALAPWQPVCPGVWR